MLSLKAKVRLCPVPWDDNRRTDCAELARDGTIVQADVLRLAFRTFLSSAEDDCVVGRGTSGNVQCLHKGMACEKNADIRASVDNRQHAFVNKGCKDFLENRQEVRRDRI